jgi:hypothetical protein
MKKIIIALALFAISAVLSAENLVINSTFDAEKNGMPDGWILSSVNGIKVEQQETGRVLHMTNTTNEYKQVSQNIEITPGTIPCITVKAKIKISNIVPGGQEWEMARVMVLFFDAKGVQTGGWPELGRWKGTSDWGDKLNIINVPPDAKTIKISPELSNCTGEMWVDDLQISAGCKLDIPRDADDLLMNGDMEFGSGKPLYWGGWIANEGTLESPGYKSPSCYKITNTSPLYSMLTQEIAIDSSKIAVVTVSGWYKTENVVQGINPWEKARISIEIHDDRERIGAWPPVTGEAAGTVSEWAYMENTYQIPKECKKIIISAGLLNCTGTMWVDKIKITGKTSSGKIFKPVVIKQEDRSSWWAFKPEPDSYTAEAVIDLTFTLDAPAGKHGAITITAKDGSLQFEDATAAKFWGTNLVASDIFRTHAETDLMVKRLAKLGCNMVRLHHMDAYWADPGIYDKTATDTKTFSPESMDRLDYLVFKLKEAGIYVFLDMMVNRKLKPGDGIEGGDKLPAGLKEVVFIDEKLQQKEIEYIDALFNHENFYTKIKYKDEPAVVFTEIINESSVFYWDRNKEIPQIYTDKLNTMFNSFLKLKYLTMQELKTAWDKSGDSNLGPEEDFDKGTVKRETFSINWEDWRAFGTALSTGRGADTKMFYFDIQKKFYDKMYAHIKNLGVKCLVAGSNHWEKWDADIASNAAYDFIDRHTYWDHPSGGWTMQENISYKNSPMLKSQQNCVAELAHARVYKKPFTVSEWNAVLPNEFRAGAPVVMAAYGRLQDWDCMLQFNFGQYEWQPLFQHFADFSRDPVSLSAWLPSVLIFRYNYLKTSQEKIIDYVSENDMFNKKNSAFKLVNNDYASPLMIYTAKTFKKSEESTVFSPAINRGSALSMTQELYWNLKKGIFQITSDKIQGAAGFLKDGVFKSKNLKISCDNRYASIFLMSLDMKSISESEKIVLNASARIDNTGVQYSPSKTSVIFGGSSPIIVEPVYSTVTVTLKAFASAKIYTLDANGYKSGEYKNFVRTGNNSLVIRTDEKSRALNYYIEISR